MVNPLQGAIAIFILFVISYLYLKANKRLKKSTAPPKIEKDNDTHDIPKEDHEDKTDQAEVEEIEVQEEDCLNDGMPKSEYPL